MMDLVRGNLFESSAHALVNTVNCVGIMGKGIAYQFKRSFPAYFQDYQRRCKRGEVRLGEVYAYLDSAKLIISFPTKEHWKSNSRLNDIDAGLISLRELLLREHVRHVAVPPLGCGNGGLAWADVRPLIEARLGDLPDVSVEVYEPAGSFEAKVAMEPRVTLGHFVLVALRIGLTKPTRLAIQKAAYLFNVFSDSDYFSFTEHKFGPYCPAIEPMFNAIRDYMEFTHLTAEEMLRDGYQRRLSGADGERMRRWQPVFERVHDFCNRNAAEIEAIATAHAVLARGGPMHAEALVQEFLSWSEEKAENFGRADVLRAVETLEREGLVDRTLLGFAIRPSDPIDVAQQVDGLRVPPDLVPEVLRFARVHGLTVDAALRQAISGLKDWESTFALARRRR